MMMYPGGLEGYLADYDRNKKEDTVASQFGNPIWGHDDNEASEEERRGRKQGLQEALRLIEGPSIMSNNREFDTGVNATIDLLKRRLAEL